MVVMSMHAFCIAHRRQEFAVRQKGNVAIVYGAIVSSKTTTIQAGLQVSAATVMSAPRGGAERDGLFRDLHLAGSLQRGDE